MKGTIYFLFLFVLLSCNDEPTICFDNPELCGQLANGKFTNALVDINEYLQDQDYDNGRDNLNDLRKWLECSSCITYAEINCYWCQYSNPPQGSIQFRLVQSTDTLQLHLIGSEPIEAKGISMK